MKKWLPVLLVPALVLIGAGLWVYFSNQPDSRPVLVIGDDRFNIPSSVPAPQGQPVISMSAASEGASTSEHVYIYENRVFLAIQKIEKREDLGRQEDVKWRINQLSQAEFDSIISLITTKSGELYEYYQLPSFGTQENPVKGDMDTILTINYQGIQKKVTAVDFLSLYSSFHAGTYAGMPSPLADICEKLHSISMKVMEVITIHPG